MSNRYLNLRLYWLVLLFGFPMSNLWGSGFQVNRFEPTPAGESSFVVDSPLYKKNLTLSVGLSFNYAYRPLRYGVIQGGDFFPTQLALAHQFITHLDLAVAFSNRWIITASMPLTIAESGAGYDATGIQPLVGLYAGDFRLGARLRAFRFADKDPFSISAGLDLWIPTYRGVSQLGENGIRLMPKLIFGGTLGRFHWSSVLGFYYRPNSTIGDDPQTPYNGMGSQIVLGASAGVDVHKNVQLSVEGSFNTVVTQGHPFSSAQNNLEVLAGAHFRIKDFLLSVAGGPGVFEASGSPAFRAVVRVAYSPRQKQEVPEQKPIIVRPKCEDIPKDSDDDGVPDVLDRCPLVHKNKYGLGEDPNQPGCPLEEKADTDKDGVIDVFDMCKMEKGPKENNGCPWPDADKDMIPDREDACPTQPGAPNADPHKNGCPALAVVRNNKIEIAQPVYFATNKDVILKKSYPVMEAVLLILQNMPQINVSIEGHTDSRSGVVFNQGLSERRAKSVMNWLLKRGISDKRLSSQGFGLTRPIDTNKTAKGRANNRRVEFIIIPEADK